MPAKRKARQTKAPLKINFIWPKGTTREQKIRNQQHFACSMVALMALSVFREAANEAGDLSLISYLDGEGGQTFLNNIRNAAYAKRNLMSRKVFRSKTVDSPGKVLRWDMYMKIWNDAVDSKHS